jgi:CubicO group peptidase (beta-lactamase class C family)
MMITSLRLRDLISEWHLLGVSHSFIRVEIDGAFEGIYSTADDMVKFLKMIFNDGMGENSRVLESDTLKQVTSACSSE